MSFLSFFKKQSPKDLPPLKFHNTLSGNLEEFAPLSLNKVKIYACGPTAYDTQHIGNLFPPVVMNILHRTLNVWGYKVQAVNNITDFGHISEDEAAEDKMSKGLRREGLTMTLANMRKLAEKYAQLFFDDLPLLGIDPKKIQFPRASDYIPEQVSLIKSLEQKSYAYPTSDGVYYDVSKFKTYGKLGNIDLAGLQEGARVVENPEKHSPFDFALWKLDKKLGWKSPWGLGFPGWHIECTAMIFKLLGKQIDIHMGGIDLIPTHHNNEIAQAEALTGKQYVKYWIHNAHITIEGKKVSKSIGNTIYLHNLVDKGLNPRALRYWFMTGHYRSPMNFTWEAITGADTALKRLTRAYLELPQGGVPHVGFLKNFYQKMANDLDTAGALAETWNFIKGDGAYADVSPADKKASLAKVDAILGLGFSDPQQTAKLKVLEQKDLPTEVQSLVDEREAARAVKDFTKADTLRQEIERKGFELKDAAGGPQITKK
jgi:cysteinyl-tRNA synthetase